MRREIKFGLKAIQLWSSAMLIFFAPCIFALGLGDIHVSSNLGEPLKAQIVLLDLERLDLQDLKARLASAEEYKKNGLQFPEGLKFRFKIEHEAGTPPIIRVSSVTPVNEPFVNLLVQFSSPLGTLFKSYTFLLDPASAGVQPAKVDEADSSTSTDGEPAVQIPKPQEKIIPKIVKPRSKRVVPPVIESVENPQVEARATPARESKRAPLFGKLSLTLSTSLSISKSEPTLADARAPMTSDALQEELIAKEKSLTELNAQIGEMQSLIKNLQTKLVQHGASEVVATEVAASSVPVQSEAIASAVETTPTVAPVLEVAAIKPPPLAADKSFNVQAWLQANWQRAGAVLALLVLIAGLVYWYLKRREAQAWYHGPFEDEPEVPAAQTVSEKTSARATEFSPSIATKAEPVKPVAQTKISNPALDKLIKVPAVKEQKAAIVTPPEYDFLEEADIYLRFGHDKLAEEVLRDAIKINPANPHGYLTLLHIFEERGDLNAFATTARELKAIGDESAWQKAVEQGRKLDPQNPMYH